MKRLSIIILLSALSCAAICQPSELMNDGNGPAFGFFTVGAYVRIED
jgi:hypothetical protein